MTYVPRLQWCCCLCCRHCCRCCCCREGFKFLVGLYIEPLVANKQPPHRQQPAASSPQRRDATSCVPLALPPIPPPVPTEANARHRQTRTGPNPSSRRVFSMPQTVLFETRPQNRKMPCRMSDGREKKDRLDQPGAGVQGSTRLTYKATGFRETDAWSAQVTWTFRVCGGRGVSMSMSHQKIHWRRDGCAGRGISHMRTVQGGAPKVFPLVQHAHQHDRSPEKHPRTGPYEAREVGTRECVVHEKHNAKKVIAYIWKLWLSLLLSVGWTSL